MFSEVILGAKMKVFVLLVLGVLGCSLTGARIVSKCELREKLMLAITNLPEKAQQSGLSGENLVAKSECWMLLLHYKRKKKKN